METRTVGPRRAAQLFIDSEDLKRLGPSPFDNYSLELMQAISRGQDEITMAAMFIDTPGISDEDRAKYQEVLDRHAEMAARLSELYGDDYDEYD